MFPGLSLCPASSLLVFKLFPCREPPGEKRECLEEWRQRTAGRSPLIPPHVRPPSSRKPSRLDCIATAQQGSCSLSGAPLCLTQTPHTCTCHLPSALIFPELFHFPHLSNKGVGWRVSTPSLHAGTYWEPMNRMGVTDRALPSCHPTCQALAAIPAGDCDLQGHLAALQSDPRVCLLGLPCSPRSPSPPFGSCPSPHGALWVTRTGKYWGWWLAPLPSNVGVVDSM